MEVVSLSEGPISEVSLRVRRLSFTKRLSDALRSVSLQRTHALRKYWSCTNSSSAKGNSPYSTYRPEKRVTVFC